MLNIEMNLFLKQFYKGKKVLITGHTGFKGTWMCKVLTMLGAEVTGYALEPPTDPSVFALSGIEKDIHHVIGDIRDYDAMCAVFQEARPEIVFHLAAQPIVLESYHSPRYTYEANVMGTVNVLECVRNCPSVKSVLNVTTDKVYRNNEWEWGYRENDPLDGFDPYSNSKSCSELVTASYIRSFFRDQLPVSTARAGNVIGGGDFAKDRIIPDCVRAVESGTVIGIRNPFSTRPYQHVLEPVYCYLMIAAMQAQNPQLAGSYNIGPDDCDCVTTGALVDLFCRTWGAGAAWENLAANTAAPHEAGFLKLDCSRLKRTFGWTPRWHIAEAIAMICDFSRVWLTGGCIAQEMEGQIRTFWGNAF